MTEQQLQYAYWQKMRQQQLYKAYVGGGDPTNSYDKIAKVSPDCFLNYIEYSPKNINSKNAVDYLKKHEDPQLASGRCTGVFDKDSGIAVRQLDWFYNDQAEFIVKMNADRQKGIYSSIGVTAASKMLTRNLSEHLIATGQYYDYFDVIPFFTVDGVNENGVFAQSNVVMKEGVDIDVKKEGAVLEECCIVMLVRYILDHFTKYDLVSATSVHDKLFNNLHIYGTTKLAGYNSHILVAHYDEDEQYSKSYVIEFQDSDSESEKIIVNEFPIMTNFRTFRYNSQGEPQPIPTSSSKKIPLAYWGEIEQRGIGLERWNTAAEFLDDYAGSGVDEFKNLRSMLNYTHAYDEQFESEKTWLTDNLSGDLTVDDMRDYHENPETATKKDYIEGAMAGYRAQFSRRSRETGETWHTTHGAIYDTVNLSCNIQSQQDTEWNVLFDGTITSAS